uniref:Signaling threshold regulating transmembrane adaptor 1 n=1 Tax=Canis lupus dingo TaxID=286419 RepID=A0A8C0KW54_CANLU
MSAVMSRSDNYTSDLLVPGIPSVAQAWGLWALLAVVSLLLLISLAAHLFRWTSGQGRSHPKQERSGGSVEEVPLYGNLPYLQTGRKLAEGRGTEATHVLGGWDEGLQEEEPEVTRLVLFPIPGRLSQEPGPDQQDPTPRGPAMAAEEVMCYTSLQLRPSQGHIPSPGTPIKYSEVVLDSEPKPQASGPEPELYASVCAQTRRARASFPDQAYANSQPAPS